MSAAEVGDWAMYEELYGPLLVHDRIDYGLASVAFTVAKIGGAKRAEFRHFLPPWLRELAAEDSVRRGFERLRQMAMENPHAVD